MVAFPEDISVTYGIKWVASGMTLPEQPIIEEEEEEEEEEVQETLESVHALLRNVLPSIRRFKLVSDKCKNLC